MIQQFRDVLRLRTAANLSEGREMIDYADYSKNPHTRTCGLRTPRLKFGKKGAYI